MVDASWPKPLPNDWRIGQVGGIAVDSHDNIWVYHRPRTLDASSAGAMPRTATNDQGVPISALGHPRPYAERSTGCCVPAPSVLKFDREGNLLTAWGGPSDPGFLDENCREADGCFWPAREHGIFVDHNDFVYVVRQRRGRRRPPATDVGDVSVGAVVRRDDSHILKFTADGTFVYQIGTAGMDGPNSEKIDGGPNGTPQPYLVADMSVDAKTNRLYIADGYGNRRILIVDAATGQYVGHFGAYGQNPVVDDPSSGVADTDVGPWIADYQAGNLKPLFFRSPMHCATVSRDGFLYACDRGNNRVQIFELGAADLGKPCANPSAEAGKCGFVGEIHVAPQTASGTSGTATLSTDPEQSCLYVGDLGTARSTSSTARTSRSSTASAAPAARPASSIGCMRSPSTRAATSTRAKWTRGSACRSSCATAPASCSGTGSAEVGLYGTTGELDDAHEKAQRGCSLLLAVAATRRRPVRRTTTATRT